MESVVLSAYVVCPMSSLHAAICDGRMEMEELIVSLTKYFRPLLEFLPHPLYWQYMWCTDLNSPAPDVIIVRVKSRYLL